MWIIFQCQDKETSLRNEVTSQKTMMLKSFFDREKVTEYALIYILEELLPIRTGKEIRHSISERKILDLGRKW